MTEKRRTFAQKIAAEIHRARRRYIDDIFSFARPAQTAPVNLESKHRYRSAALTSKPDTFLLVRIIGNDLEPRHMVGQSRENVEFILRNEPELPDVRKFWVLNRIIDNDERGRLVKLLEEHDQEYALIDFSIDDYAKVGWDFDRLPTPDFMFSKEYAGLDDRLRTKADVALRRKKVAYAINNNGARNFALNIKRGEVKWILPWDGNCFLTKEAFDAIAKAIRRQPDLPYVIVPMVRLEDNSLVLDPAFSRKAAEEPQVVFRADAVEAFNGSIPDGRRPKIDLLWRLGVPGRWDRYDVDPWDEPRPPPSLDAGLFQRAGWVARLNSGKPELEIGKGNSQRRAISRDEAILATIARLDGAVAAAELAKRPDTLLYYDLNAISSAANDALLSAELRAQADLALGRGLQSVVHKTTISPSKDPHDYVNPAPYWWPDPESTDKPYVRRDGERVPGTELFEPGSEQFDRSRLQRLFDDTTCLALAWKALGESTYAERAAQLIRTWFLDERTRMNPHLRFAQIVGETRSKKGYGILEFKDVYYFLDAVRIVEQSGALTKVELARLREWFTTYAGWLDTIRRPNKLSGSERPGLYSRSTLRIANYLGDVSQLKVTGGFAAAGCMADSGGRIPPFGSSAPRPSTTACLPCKAGPRWPGFFRPSATTSGTSGRRMAVGWSRR